MTQFTSNTAPSFENEKALAEEMERRYYGFELSASYETENGRASDIEAKASQIGSPDIIIGTAFLTFEGNYYIDYQQEGFQNNRELNILLKNKVKEMASEMFRGKKMYQGNRVDVLRYSEKDGSDILREDGSGLRSIPAPLKLKHMERE